MLKFIEMVLKPWNNFEISEFYQPRTFAKVEKLMRFVFEISKFSGKWKREGLLPFEFPERKLGWRFTARCHSEAGQKGRLHADTFDHAKVVFEDVCCDGGAWEWHNSCGEDIESYRNCIKVWKWFWIFRVLSIPDIFKKFKNDEIFRFFLIFGKMKAGGAPALRAPRAETWLTVYRSLP